MSSTVPTTMEEGQPLVDQPTEEEQRDLLLQLQDCFEGALRPVLDPEDQRRMEFNRAGLTQVLQAYLQSDLCREWSWRAKFFRMLFVRLGCKWLMRQQFRANLEQDVAHGTMGAIFDFESLPTGWKYDRDILIEAYAFGFIDYPIASQRLDYYNDANHERHDRFREAWTVLPLNLAQKLIIPCLLQFPEDAALAWTRFPHLPSDKPFWEGVIADPETWLPRVGFADASINGDRDLMFQVCMRDIWVVYDGIAPALAQDATFFLDVVRERPEAAHMFPMENQRAHRDLIMEQLPPFDNDFITEFADEVVPPEFFDNEAYRSNWIANGGLFSSFPARLGLENDKATFRLFASNQYNSFEDASQELRSDKEFMLEVLEMEPKIYEYVAEDLQRDVDIRMAAARDLDPSNENDMQLFGDIFTLVQAGLTNRAAFETFCFGTHPNSGSPISFINRDVETFDYIMNCFASFVGVPEGDVLQRMRNCFQGGDTSDNEE